MASSKLLLGLYMGLIFLSTISLAKALTQAQITQLLQGLQANPVAATETIKQLLQQLQTPGTPSVTNPTAPVVPTTNQRRPAGLFNHGPFGNYLTARAFDMGDTATNMMMLNDWSKPQGQQGTQQQQLPTRGDTPPLKPQQAHRGGLFGGSPMGNYFTARALDFGDTASSMMLFNGGNRTPLQPQGTGTTQQQQQQQQQSTFDPLLWYLWS